MKQLKNNFIFQAWLVLLLALCFGSSLAGVNLVLSPIIEANKINETMQKIPELILGADAAAKLATDGKSLDINSQIVSLEKNNKKKFYKVFQAVNEEKILGWVVKSSGQGYADKIELLIGFNPSMKEITGLFILDQKETPGLGNKIMHFDFRKQFISKKTDQPLFPTKITTSAPNAIDAITGATISTRSVCSIINDVATDLRSVLSKKTFKEKI